MFGMLKMSVLVVLELLIISFFIKNCYLSTIMELCSIILDVWMFIICTDVKSNSTQIFFT